MYVVGGGGGGLFSFFPPANGFFLLSAEVKNPRVALRLMDALEV